MIAAHGILAEQQEKPDDLLDNYFLPGEDDFEVSIATSGVGRWAKNFPDYGSVFDTINFKRIDTHTFNG